MYFKTYQVLFKLNTFQKCLSMLYHTDLFHHQSLQHNCSQTIVLERWEERWLMEHIHSHHINSCWRKEPRLAQNINTLCCLPYISYMMQPSSPLEITWFSITVFFMPYNNKSFINKVSKNELGKNPVILSSCLVKNPRICILIFFPSVGRKAWLSLFEK